MALHDARLKLAVRVAERALRATPDAALDARLDAFRTAFDTVRALDAGPDDWTEDTLEAAWQLAAAAWPDGGAAADVAASLADAHRVVRSVAEGPGRGQPARPRRDA
ncbi:MAG TPA: hypothetical protein VFX50_00280 [Gemmatimonadales bacterium]|nr:hypothetical protein [Gemmatimonadales bacterium]